MVATQKIIVGDCRTVLAELPERSVQCVVTSPPYWGLRDYKTTEWVGGDLGCTHSALIQSRAKRSRGGLEGGTRTIDEDTIVNHRQCHCGARLVNSGIGLEESFDDWLAAMVDVMRGVRRVLRDDGTVWVNCGDAYTSGGRSTYRSGASENKGHQILDDQPRPDTPESLKPKDLIGMPWRLAFALQADGWWLRSDVIWCLSGGTWLYVRTQKGDMPMTIKDMARLDPRTVQLWNGDKWVQLLGISKSERSGNELEIVLRSGERISCSPSHRFPTSAGLVEARALEAGDVLTSCKLPEPETVRDCVIDDDAAWFAGLYIAEGSRSEDTIQIAGHTKECERWDRVRRIAAKFGGYATISNEANNQTIRVYGKLMNAIVDELVAGRTAHDKGVAAVVWRYSNAFLAALLDGYLSGDGHADGNRWRLGFCRNYNLERDLRTACARLGYTLTLNLASTEYDGQRVPTFRGEIRKDRSGHHNERERNEIVAIKKARCRHVYDIGVDGEPHLFALASGILTHNSKPNPMPESVTDRPTKSHEYVFLFTKRARYFYDADAVREDGTYSGMPERLEFNGKWSNEGMQTAFKVMNGTRNLRSVWTLPTQPFSGAHFATFPEKLVATCLKAGTSDKGCCPACGAPWRRVVEKDRVPTRPGMDSKVVKNANPPGSKEVPPGQPPQRMQRETLEIGNRDPERHVTEYRTAGWEPTCKCEGDICMDCAKVLEWNDETNTYTEGRAPKIWGCTYLRMVRNVLSEQGIKGRSADTLVQSNMSSNTACENQEDDERMDNNNEGVPPYPSAKPPERKQGRIRHGASTCNGKGSGEAAAEVRSGTPQERKEVRQSTGELGSDVRVQTQQNAEAAQANNDGDLSMLQGNNISSRACPSCGGKTIKTSSAVVPCLVGDVFSGAGTTGVVCRRMGANYIGIELNPEYADMSRRRIANPDTFGQDESIPDGEGLFV